MAEEATLAAVKSKLQAAVSKTIKVTDTPMKKLSKHFKSSGQFMSDAKAKEVIDIIHEAKKQLSKEDFIKLLISDIAEKKGRTTLTKCPVIFWYMASVTCVPDLILTKSIFKGFTKEELSTVLAKSLKHLSLSFDYRFRRELSRSGLVKSEYETFNSFYLMLYTFGSTSMCNINFFLNDMLNHSTFSDKEKEALLDGLSSAWKTIPSEGHQSRLALITRACLCNPAFKKGDRKLGYSNILQFKIAGFISSYLLKHKKSRSARAAFRELRLGMITPDKEHGVINNINVGKVLALSKTEKQAWLLAMSQVIRTATSIYGTVDASYTNGCLRCLLDILSVLEKTPPKAKYKPIIEKNLNATIRYLKESIADSDIAWDKKLIDNINDLPYSDISLDSDATEDLYSTCVDALKKTVEPSSPKDGTSVELKRMR